MSPLAVELLRQRRRQIHAATNPAWTPEMRRVLAASIADLTDLVFDGGTVR